MQRLSEKDHARGPEAAPVTLVEYGDFECPYTARASAVVHELARRYRKDLRVVFRHNPLGRLHPHAERASLAAEAAATQGKFWEMHDTLFEHQGALEDEDLVRYARALGLDVHRFVRDMNAPETRQRVSAHTEERKTPTFYVNGERVDVETPDVPALARAIDQALRRRH